MSKLRVCVYARVSTSHDEQNLSFENQQFYYQEYVKSHEDWELLHIYADKGKSGTILGHKRPEFNEMLKACGLQVLQTSSTFLVQEIEDVVPQYDLIICKDEKRFARSTEITTIINHLKNRKVGVFFETLNINTLEKDDITLKVLFAVAEEYSRNLSKNLKLSYQRQHLARPMILGKNPPFGYKFGLDKNNERTLEPISKEYVNIVNTIYNLYCAGNGFRVIASYVQKAGFKTLEGKDIQKYTIERIIKNEKYKGYIQVLVHTPQSLNHYGHTRRKFMDYKLIKSPKIVPMVTEELWDKANKILSEKPISQNSRGINYKKSKYSNKILCLNCYNYYIKTKDSKNENVYVCSTKRERLGNANLCKSPYVSESFIDEYVDELLHNNGFLSEEARRVNEIKEYVINFKYSLIATFLENRNEPLIIELRSKKAQLEKEQDEILERFKNLPEDVVNRRIMSLQKEIDVLQESLNKEDFSLEQFKKELDMVNATIKSYELYKMDNIKTQEELLKVIEIRVSPRNPESSKRQKRNDCTLDFRSIYSDEYQEFEYTLTKNIKLQPAANLLRVYSDEERKSLDERISHVLS